MTAPRQPNPDDPHGGQPVLAYGVPLDEAQAAVVMLHGRGASAGDILTLAVPLEAPGVSFLAPQAAGGAWYPDRFNVHTSRNEPWLSSALRLVGELMADVEAAGVPPEKTVLLGFSQGGCLALEYAARNAKRYGGVVGLSSGLIGADDEPRPYQGNLQGTPVFLGCSDMDPHISEPRVRQAADTMRELGGEVTMRLYPGMGHTVNEDELEFVRGLIAQLLAA